LVKFYNLLDRDSIERYEVFLCIINFAKIHQQVELLQRHFQEIDRLVKEWKINLKQERELYRAIRDSLRECNERAEAHKFTVRFLKTFQDESPEMCCLEETSQAVIEAIRVPNIFLFDELLELRPVKLLEQNNPKLWQLLQIFVQESLEAYSKFAAENSDFLKDSGLDHEECIAKMLLLSLASLAVSSLALSGSGSGEISYATIARTLHLSSDLPSEVERIIVKAVALGIINAKLDQQRRVVLVTRGLQRVFTRSQWKQLNDTLNIWTSNIDLLLKTIRENSKMRHQSLLVPQS